MAAFYIDNEYLAYDPENLMIYRVNPEHLKTRSWYYRYKQQSGKYLHRSLKQKDKGKALIKLYEVWKEIKRLEHYDLDYSDKKFTAVLAAFLSESKDIPQYHRYELFLNFISKPECPLHDISIQDLENKHWVDFVAWRCLANKKEKPLMLDTIGQDRGRIMRVLRYAVIRGFRRHLPELMPPRELQRFYPLRRTKTKSGACSGKKWSSIMAQLRHWAFWDHQFAVQVLGIKGLNKLFSVDKAQIDECLRTRKIPIRYGRWHGLSDIEKRRFSRKRLYFFILISEHTLLRPSKELSTMVWRDVEYDKDSKGRIICSLRTHSPKETRHNETRRSRIAISTYKGTQYILRWLKISRQFGLGGPDDYMFPKWPEDGHGHIKAGYLGFQLRRFLDRITRDDPKGRVFNFNAHGERITLYSCRHQAIRRRIKAGLPLGQIATMANNSLQTISSTYFEEFMEVNKPKYANQFRLGREPEMNVENWEDIQNLYTEFVK